jgi:hypothetical protein
MPEAARPRRSAPHRFDPKSPAFLAWLADLDPRTELMVRVAMQACFPNLHYDRAWRTRFDRLMKELKVDTELFAAITLGPAAYPCHPRPACG